MSLDRALRDRLEAAGQDWIADHIADLEPARAEALSQQLARLDCELITSIRAGEGLAGTPEGVLGTIDYVPVGDRGESSDAIERGRDALRNGQVGFVILAGGQASRLRYEGPKGEFPI